MQDPQLIALAKIARALGVTRPTHPDFLFGLQRLFREVGICDLLIKQEEELAECLAARVGEAKEMSEHLTRMCTEFPALKERYDADNLHFAQEREFYIRKIKEYKHRTDLLIEQVNSSSVSQDLTHAALVDLLHEYEQLEAEYQPIAEQLGSTKDLPASATLARIKVLEEKEKVLQLDKLLAAKLAELGSGE